LTIIPKKYEKIKGLPFSILKELTEHNQAGKKKSSSGRVFFSSVFSFLKNSGFLIMTTTYIIVSQEES